MNSRDEATRRRWKKPSSPAVVPPWTIPRFHTDKLRETSESIKESPPRSLPVTSRPLFSIAQPSSPSYSSFSVLLFAESQSLKKFFFPRTPRLLRGESNINQITSCTRTNPPSPFLSPPLRASSSVSWATRQRAFNETKEEWIFR